MEGSNADTSFISDKWCKKSLTPAVQEATGKLREDKKWTRYTIFRTEIFHQPTEMD